MGQRRNRNRELRRREAHAVSQANRPQQQQQSIQVREETAVAYSGPIPDPQTLKGYEVTLPGSAERIIAMAERESAHRHRMEEQRVGHEVEDAKAQRAETKRGQYSALTSVLSIIVLAGLVVVVVPDGRGVAGAAAMVGAELVALVYAFVAHRKPTAPPQKTQSSGPLAKT